MKTSRGRYYFGRVIKAGILNHEKLIDALREPVAITKQTYSWTITDFKEYALKSKNDTFYFGFLTKFVPDGSVTRLDRENFTQIDQFEPDMIIARSPFIYFPQYSGLVYLHVWNYIQQEVFVNRFSEIVKAKYDDFFVDCIIEPITDLRTFFTKISSLQSIERIKATVHPPNPLFGHFWRKLKDYLLERNVSEMKIDEKSDPGKSIDNDLKKIINVIISEEKIESIKQVDIGDAAILMAADGYGHGHIEGTEGNKMVIVSTRETKLSILFDKEPDPIELKNQVIEIFEDINKKRHMDH